MGGGGSRFFKGFPTMKTVSITVRIQVHDDGLVVATHAPTTAADTALLGAMRFGGQDVVAAALLGEAVRRQANLAVGLAGSDPALMALLRSGDVKETAKVAAQVLQVVSEVSEGVAALAVKGAVSDIEGSKTKDTV